MNSIRLTDGGYWDAGYDGGHTAPLAPADFRHLNDRRLIEQLVALSLEGKHILEIGAGNSAILTHLARRYAGRARFTGLDYSPQGCRMLARRAEREGAEVQVEQQDLFQPVPELLGRFDLVFSLGVVEHFTDLAEVLRAKARFLAPTGTMFTLIPNMAGVLGVLTRRYNPRVYALHVPHDMVALATGHRSAGLEVLRCGYLCSTNFGVLSSCFSSSADTGYGMYRALSRVSKVLWWFESRLGDLPHTRVLSPYIYAVSRPAA